MDYGIIVLFITVFLLGMGLGAMFREWQIKKHPYLFKLKKESH